MSERQRLSLLAPAKINLYLHITGRRDDGYHLLDSLVVFADTGDMLTVEPRDHDITFHCTGPFAHKVGPDSDNLVVRAAHKLRDRCGHNHGAHITLQKNLPVAAGIGGGSSDAAACLRLLTVLWDTPIDDQSLRTLGASLGADVPVCLRGEAAFFSGIGDILTPTAALPDFHLVLVNPLKGLSTPDVFQARRGAFTSAAAWTDPITDFPGLIARLGQRRNDLTAAATDLVPEIGIILDALMATQTCHLARLSGSGATCFGLFASAADAAAAAQKIKENHPAWWVEAAASRFVPSNITSARNTSLLAARLP